MAAAAGGVCGLLAPIMAGSKLLLLVGLGLCAGVGLAVYGLLCLLLKLDEAKLCADLIRKILKRG